MLKIYCEDDDTAEDIECILILFDAIGNYGKCLMWCRCNLIVEVWNYDDENELIEELLDIEGVRVYKKTWVEVLKKIN